VGGFDFLDPFVLFCGVELLAVFALVVIAFGLGVNCVYMALSLHGYVTPAVADLLLAPQAEPESESESESEPEPAGEREPEEQHK